MTTAQGVRAGRAFVEIGANDTQLNIALRRVQTRLKRFGTELSSIGSSISSAGGTLFSYGAAASLPFGLSTKTFADFDDRMRAVKAVSQSTEAEFQRLTSKAKELGRTTSFTASQVADLMIELGRAGFNANQIDTMTQAVLNLSRATGTDAALSAGIMSATIRQFGLDAQDAVRVSDALTAAANKSFNTVEGLGYALSYVGTNAADLNMSVEETLAILGALGNVGIQGTNAGTALRRLLVIGAAEAKEMKRIFGVDFVDSAGKLRPLVDSLDDVNTATANLTDADRSAKFAEAFGLLGITSASSIAKNAMNAKQLLKDILAARGVAADTAQQMDAGIGGTFRILISALEGVSLAIGETLAPMIQTAGAAITNFLETVSAWVEQNRGLVIGLAATAGTILGMGMLLLSLGVAFKVAAFAVGGLAIAVGVAKALLAGFLAIAGAVLSPLGLTIGVVLALAAAILYMSGAAHVALKWLGDRFGWIYEQAQETIGAIASALVRGDIAAAANILWLSLKSAWLQGTHWLSEIWLDLKHGMIQAWVEVEAVIRKGFVWIVTQFEKARAMLARAGESLGNSYANTEEKKSAFNQLRDTNAELDAQFAAGELTEEQFAKKRAQAEKIYHDQINYANKAHDAEEKASQEAVDKRLAELEAYYDESMTAIDNEHQQMTNANAAEYNQSQADLDKQMQDAQKAYKKAVGDEQMTNEISKDGWLWGSGEEQMTNEISKDGWLWGSGEDSESQTPKPDDIRKRIADMMSGMDSTMEMTNNARSVGNFNAAAVAFGTGSSPLKKSEDLLAIIAKNTAKGQRLVADS